MDHDEISDDTWMNKKDEWLEYLGKDVLFTAFVFARYSKRMEEITGFGMENNVTLLSLGWKCYKSLRDESDESIYTYEDKYIRWFVRQRIKGDRCTIFGDYYQSKLAYNVFRAILEELNVKGTIREVIEAYVKCMSGENK